MQKTLLYKTIPFRTYRQNMKSVQVQDLYDSSYSTDASSARGICNMNTLTLVS